MIRVFKNLIGWYKKSLLSQLVSSFSGAVGFFLVISIIIVAIFAPQISPYSPTETDVMNQLTAPSLNHLMGTDELGRDIFSRIIFGARIALLVSLPAIAIGLGVAMFLGSLAGLSPGYLDNILVFLFDVVRSIPALIFAITILTLAGGTSIMVLVLVIGITRFPGYSRLIRASAERVGTSEYVLAARSAGASTPRLLRYHVIPNAVGPAFIQAAMDIPVVIMYEAALSFLGLGVPPPIPSWGTILRTGYSYIRICPWLVLFGGLALVWATLGFTLLGEAIRDVMDPKLRESPKI